MSLRALVCIVVVIATSLAVLAQQTQPSESKETALLSQVDAVTKAVKVVRYHAVAEQAGPFQPLWRDLEGDVILCTPKNPPVPGKMRIDCTYRELGYEKPRRLSAGYDGKKFYVVNYAEKKVYLGDTPRVFGPQAGSIAGSLMMREFVVPEPFADEINAEESSLKAETRVGHEMCVQVHVRYSAEPRQESTWYFSRSDHLPRRVDRLTPTLEGDTSVRTLILTKVEADPEIDDADLMPGAAESFEKIEGTSP